MTGDLILGIVLTALAYAGLMWAVIHGIHVVEQVKRGEYPHHPNPKRRPSGQQADEREDSARE